MVGFPPRPGLLCPGLLDVLELFEFPAPVTLVLDPTPFPDPPLDAPALEADLVLPGPLLPLVFFIFLSVSLSTRQLRPDRPVPRDHGQVRSDRTVPIFQGTPGTVPGGPLGIAG